ncbi:MAG: DUF2293 domain-containing protein [Desulfobulbaceae bacterium]|nr:DUF2293 domain-containing protein [Desulfobulbaceae bacterium]
MDNKKILNQGPDGVLLDECGNKLTPPENWVFLPAGDAGVTRKVTAKGQFWRIQIQKGRRMISTGVWAPRETIAQAQKEMEVARSTPQYQKILNGARQRRERKQGEYEIKFLDEVRKFLGFAPKYFELEKKLAEAITGHAVPVGSGSVARTSQIPIEERAERAVIAWMRHKTTAYEAMKIPRVKGKRREVRRMLAQHSRSLLDSYRRGEDIAPTCPLHAALSHIQSD